MKIDVPKEWFINGAHIEYGAEIEAGWIESEETEGTVHSLPENVVSMSQSISFGRFVTLMRRKRGWTIQDLAEAAEIEPEELLVLEHFPQHSPELSTVVSLAKTFSIPVQNAVKLAGLAEHRSERLREEGLRFAAQSEPKGTLTHDEEVALQAFLKVIVDDSDTR
jgi:HTH-type transcriptional regulator, competence development regulator